MRFRKLGGLGQLSNFLLENDLSAQLNAYALPPTHMEHKCECNSCMAAIKADHAPCLERLLRKDYESRVVPWRVFNWAVELGRADLVGLLLQRECDTCDPVSTAIEHRHCDVLKLLLANDEQGWTKRSIALVGHRAAEELPKGSAMELLRWLKSKSRPTGTSTDRHRRPWPLFLCLLLQDGCELWECSSCVRVDADVCDFCHTCDMAIEADHLVCFKRELRVKEWSRGWEFANEAMEKGRLDMVAHLFACKVSVHSLVGYAFKARRVDWLRFLASHGHADWTESCVADVATRGDGLALLREMRRMRRASKRRHMTPWHGNVCTRLSDGCAAWNCDVCPPPPAKPAKPAKLPVPPRWCCW